MLTNIVGQLKDTPALGAWKGIDEPANPRPAGARARSRARARLPHAAGSSIPTIRS